MLNEVGVSEIPLHTHVFYLPLLSTHVYSSPVQYIGLECNKVNLHCGFHSIVILLVLEIRNQIHQNFGYRFKQIAIIFYVLILMLLMPLWIKIQFPSVITCSTQNPAKLLLHIHDTTMLTRTANSPCRPYCARNDSVALAQRQSAPS